MIFSLITAPLTAALGYLYPCYMTYKAVEKRQPNLDELIFWGKYWIVVGILWSIETLCLGLLGWIPLYSLARLLVLVYLWHPRTQGVLLLYHRAVQPVLMKHEAQIDNVLHEVQTRGKDLAMEQAQKVAGRVQTALQQGHGLVKNQYQSFTKRAATAYPGYGAPGPAYPAAPGYPPYPPQQPTDAAAAAGTAGEGAGAGGPDQMYNLRARKGYEPQQTY